MQQQIITLADEPLGIGQERACYVHPQDPDKVIKIQRGAVDKQTRRELEFYYWLERREDVSYDHIPRFYGEVDTNLGRGFVVDRIRDFDGAESRSLWWFFERGYPLAEFVPYLDDLKRNLLDNRIVFCVDMGRFNVLFRRLSPGEARLVVIDGLGNHTAINWLDNIGYFARRKIERRWRRFTTRLQHFSDETMRDFGNDPRSLEPAYRRTG